MMQSGPLPLAREVVLIGGGHTHALFLRRWGMRPLPGARLTLINPGPWAPYTGMLPGFVAGHYSLEALEIDLVRLARFAGARLILGAVEGIDRGARRIQVPGRSSIAYDIASLDIGITSSMPQIPGFTENAIAAKPMADFAAAWQAFLASGSKGPVTMIGGGIGGIELALAMRHALGSEVEIRIFEHKKAAANLGIAARRRLMSALENAGIGLEEGVTVAAVKRSTVLLTDGRELPSGFTIGAAGARPQGWLVATGLALKDGFIEVDDTLRSVSDPAIFAVGDCAHLSHAPRPKAGVYAVRAAPCLAHNIHADLTGKRRRAFRPQRDFLKLISLGPQKALAEKSGISALGGWAWVWKDWIDRLFMDRLNTPPAMPVPTLPREVAHGTAEALGPKPLCGGCGAKVGPAALDDGLSHLAGSSRSDILAAAGDDAAILLTGGARQVISTDHLRAFWDDPVVMTRIAALHALGDVWAMGAKPQAALAQVILPRMAESMQRSWLAEITETADSVFSAEGATIVGGHTTLGAELTIGFTVTGLSEREPLTLAGAREGDALILTRPIGSGTILAAEMELKARGEDVAALLTVLTRSQGDAAARLAGVAHAMTDVTGFGLGGHLARMAAASGLAAAIDLASLPIFHGAEALAEDGIRSSIWAANRAAVSATLPNTPRAALVFDPQTAGGLLAALPEVEAERAVDDLRVMGHFAARIGRMTASGPVTLTAC